MKRNSTIIFNIIISVIAFLTFFVIAEIMFRTTHLFGARISWAKPDSLIANRYVPGAKYWHNIENDHPITDRINSHGWRDKERSLIKPFSTYRIACLGDSYLDAFQVELDSHFLARTENRLNSKYDRKNELLNFGRSGCTQTEELLILQNDAIKFDPDMVILFFLPGNDIEDVSKETATDIQRPFFYISGDSLVLDTSFYHSRVFKIRSAINNFKRYSALVSLIAERVQMLRLNRLAEKKQSADKAWIAKKNSIPGPLSLCTSHPDSSYLRSYALNKNLIKAIAWFCQSRNIRFMLVTLNSPAYRPEIEQEYMAINQSFNSNFFEEDLSALAEEMQCGLFRITLAFSKCIFRKWTKVALGSLELCWTSGGCECPG